jgi:hypothetical protein
MNNPTAPAPAIPAARYHAVVQQAGEARAALQSYGAIADAMLRIKTDPTPAELIGLKSAVELLEFRIGAAQLRASRAGMVEWAEFDRMQEGA